jgi:predicted Kef-type K+ transport protein
MIIGKSLAAFLIVLAFRYSLATALMISASLAQIGEFSFILAELGVALRNAAGRTLSSRLLIAPFLKCAH